MSKVFIKRTQNQTFELARYAKKFLIQGDPSVQIIELTKQFHKDSFICGLYAVSQRLRATMIMKNIALELKLKYQTINSSGYGKLYGTQKLSKIEPTIAANITACSDSQNIGSIISFTRNDGTKSSGQILSHNLYPIALGSVFQDKRINGQQVIKAMILLDEIQRELGSVINLAEFKLNPSLLSGITSIIVYGSLIDASEAQIDRAIGILCTQNICFDYEQMEGDYNQKAIQTGLVVQHGLEYLKMCMQGIKGPQNIFALQNSIFKIFLGGGQNESAFDLQLGWQGNLFQIKYSKLRYGAFDIHISSTMQNIYNIFLQNNVIEYMNYDKIQKITIFVIEQTFNAVCTENKIRPQNRIQAESSLYFIVGLIFKKAIEMIDYSDKINFIDDMWKLLTPQPQDFSQQNLNDKQLQNIMNKIEVIQSQDFSATQFPLRIPIRLIIEMNDQSEYISDLSTSDCDLDKNNDYHSLIQYKQDMYGKEALIEKQYENLVQKLDNIENLTNQELRDIYQLNIQYSKFTIDQLITIYERNRSQINFFRLSFCWKIFYHCHLYRQQIH